MPINAIKKLLKEEIETRVNNIYILDKYQKPIDGLYHSIGSDFVEAIRQNIKKEFADANTEEMLDLFIHKYMRMSLVEWVESI
jgi:hypothetical protein